MAIGPRRVPCCSECLTWEHSQFDEIEEVFRAIDADESGTIDRNEFESAMYAAMRRLESDQRYLRGEAAETTQIKKGPVSSPDSKEKVFISANRRRTLFAKESPFVVHNAKATHKKARKEERQRYGSPERSIQSTRHEEAPAEVLLKRSSKKKSTVKRRRIRNGDNRNVETLSAHLAKQIRSKI